VDIVSSYPPDLISGATYELDSGTSMSAPHVSGIVALYLQFNPTATPAEVATAIVDGAAYNKVYDADGSPNYLANWIQPPYQLTPSIFLTTTGTSFSVTYYVPAGAGTDDWIGLYAVGAPDGASHSSYYWNYATSTSGTITVPAADAPTTAGQYEFRYFLDDGYTIVAYSSPITIVSTTTVQTPNTYPVGLGFTVSWAATGTLHSTDWLGLYASSATPGSSDSLWWEYTSGAATGSFNIPSNTITANGNYVVKYFKDGGYTVAASGPTIAVGGIYS